ncbi:hypothetical protein Vadar_009550 [Vaccinium darrowii]|uniref:Uncharacterized protein n=1 Tax=Vaccinium darrowii TaxID=229202 RepID=A0ACB7XXR6_9ERIC|nr:hypothetical protein Vadar_009550 [Vaccinium darrowii]
MTDHHHLLPSFISTIFDLKLTSGFAQNPVKFTHKHGTVNIIPQLRLIGHLEVVLGNRGARTQREKELHEGGIDRVKPSNTLSRQPPSTDRVLVSLFVDNLPEDTSQSWLQKLFNNYGVVKEVFVPAKWSKATGRRFAFVRYDCDISADVAIANAHGMWIEECKLFVKRGSFGQGEKAEPHNQKMHFHMDLMKTNSHLLDSSPTGKRTKEDQPIMSMPHGKSYANAVKGVTEAKGLVKENVITLRMQEEETAWLSTSVVAKSHLDVAVDDLAKNLNLELMLKVQVIEEDYFISKLLNEDGLSDSSSGDEIDKEDAEMDIPIQKMTNVAENMLEVGNANFIAAMTTQSLVDVDVSSNSCVGEGFLDLDDGNNVVNTTGPLTEKHVGIVYESLTANEVEEEKGREDDEIDGNNSVEVEQNIEGGAEMVALAGGLQTHFGHFGLDPIYYQSKILLLQQWQQKLLLDMFSYASFSRVPFQPYGMLPPKDSDALKKGFLGFSATEVLKAQVIGIAGCHRSNLHERFWILVVWVIAASISFDEEKVI